ATIQIERADPNVMKFQEVATFDPSFLSYQDFYQTQYKLLESEVVAKRAVKHLNLPSDPTFLQDDPPGPLSRLWTSLTSPLSGKTKVDPATVDPLLPYTQAVQAGLRVEPVKNS